MQELKSGKASDPVGAVRIDRRVRRTQLALRDALLSLLPEQGWDHIDVASLCERADIGRSTFYLHYADKADLLRSAFADLQAQLLASTPDTATASAPTTTARVNATTDLAFLPGLLDHVHEQRQVFKALLGRRSGQVVQDHFRDLLVSLFAESDRSGSSPTHAAPNTAPDARAHMLAGSLFQLLVWWLGTTTDVLPDDIAMTFRSFSVSGER